MQLVSPIHERQEPRATTGTSVPLILLPGLNGDARIFEPQAAHFPTLAVARWEQASPGETLAAYAERLARSINPSRPCLVGGVSFGGIVALEVARHLDTLACLLIASTRDVDGLPLVVRSLRPVAAFAGPAALSHAAHLGMTVAAFGSPRLRRRLRRFSPEELRFRSWAFGALPRWHPPKLRCPVYQIHGERDATFVARRSKANSVLPNAGHLITLTHADEVNAFILSAIQRHADAHE